MSKRNFDKFFKATLDAYAFMPKALLAVDRATTRAVEGAITGHQLRDKGLEAAGSGGPIAIQVSWEIRARDAIGSLVLFESDFTADDVRRIAGDPPHPNCLGAVMRQAYKKGLIQPVGVVMAERPSRHASLLRTWRGR